MNLKELAFPIRMYWDLFPAPYDSAINYRSICDQIKEMKFFTLNLMDGSPQLSNPCMEILNLLKSEMINVSLTVTPSVLSSETVRMLSDLRVHELLINIDKKDDLGLIAESVQQYKDGTLTIGASFQVSERNYMHIPEVLSFCLEKDIHRLVFPMQRVTDGDCFYVSREDGNAITAGLKEMNFENMKITIHDPFLWRIFYPAVSFPGGGCQAANSMAYITPEGKVYPCPTMPIELGDLNVSSLKAILSSKAKKDLVKSLHQSPDECNGCEELRGCMGGCSGRVYVLDGTVSRRDPACN